MKRGRVCKPLHGPLVVERAAAAESVSRVARKVGILSITLETIRKGSSPAQERRRYSKI